MANITIRNVTATFLELKFVERFDSQRVQAASTLANVAGTISGFLNATNFTSHHVLPQGGPTNTQDVTVPIGPFQISGTEVRGPEQKEVVRLTFAAGDHRYQVDIPSPNDRSNVMSKLNDGPHEFTTVYLPGPAFLAIFSSSHLPRWMEHLRNEYPLSMLSIPGTHNSPTCHVALPSVRCQAVDVREQLDNGVRFLDIRVSSSPDNDDLALVHSAFPISVTGNKYFEHMLNDIYAFLDANPSETVLMSVKREGTGKGDDHKVSRDLRNRYVNPRPDKWFTQTHIPTLGESRGRIVLMRRFGIDESLHGENDGRGWGVDAQNWPDNCEDGTVGGGLIRVQDFYEIDEVRNIDKKISFSRNQLERSAEQFFKIQGREGFDAGAGHLPFFVNFLSASNFFNATCWPERIAAKVNPAVIEHLCTRHGEAGKGQLQLGVGDASTGIVVTDWVGAHGDWDLIRCIVGMNARLTI